MHHGKLKKNQRCGAYSWAKEELSDTQYAAFGQPKQVGLGYSFLMHPHIKHETTPPSFSFLILHPVRTCGLLTQMLPIT